MPRRFIVLFAIFVISAFPSVGSTIENSFESAQVCKECHTDIYKNWKQSLHALSYKNPIFTNAYRKAYTTTAGKAKKYCLNCHAPTVRVTGDYDISLPVTAEGVTCDFCHTITEIHLDGRAKNIINKPGDTKRSVLKNAESGHHNTEFSNDFASSKLCGGCHDFHNRQGVHVGVTYSEWEESSFAKEGKQCQNCHMPEISGKTANEGGRDKIHDHSLSHNVATMKGAIVVTTEDIQKDKKKLKAKIRITNQKAGHSIPTGTPARSLVLEVKALDKKGRMLEIKKIVYKKVILDKKGNELSEDGDVFLYGEKIVSDNRLRPDESRLETFIFTKNLKKINKITAEAYFLYKPIVNTQTDMSIPLSSGEWKVK